MKATVAELKKELFDGLKQIATEVGTTLEQKGIQGSSELANALFHQSNGFVLYGPGQNPNLFVHGYDQQHEQGHEQELSRER
jgi:hypothetical protein